MLTITQIQQAIHRNYDGDTDYPESDTDDWNLRLGLIHDAINKWAYNSESVKWKELYQTLSSASSGTKTTTSGVSAYATPSDFVSISSFVKVIDSLGGNIHYRYISPDKMLNHEKMHSADRVFYITGGAGSYKINLYPTPTVTGETIEYSYYKTPDLPTTGSTVVEMSKPYFIIYDVLMVLYEFDGNNTMISKYSQLAKSIMDEMIIENETAPNMNPLQITNLEHELDGVVWGQ